MHRDAPATPRPPRRARACQNCGAPLLGEHCYACGQPMKGLVRHFSSIIGDFLDTRVQHRRARVPHARAAVRQARLPEPRILRRPPRALRQPGAAVRVPQHRHLLRRAARRSTSATTSVQFDGRRRRRSRRRPPWPRSSSVRDDGADASWREARAEHRRTCPARAPASTPARPRSAAAAAQAHRRAAARRGRRAKPPPPAKPTTTTTINLFSDGKPWDAKTNPLRDRLAARLRQRLAQRAGRHAPRTTSSASSEDPNLFKDAVLSAVPSTLFVLLPVFALMLKLLYVFKRRLYMEHLIVALHSHAFLCLALLLVFALAALERGWRRRRRRAQLLRPGCEAAAVRLDAAVPAADAEARVRAGLADDPAEVLRARHLLRHPAVARRGIHHARQPGVGVNDA